MLKLKRQFFGLIGHAGASSEARRPMRLENLRLAMLAALGQAGRERYTKLARQLRYSDDVQTLWYTRSELMAALSAMYGEARAREEIDKLTLRFRQLLPRNQRTGSVRAPR